MLEKLKIVGVMGSGTTSTEEADIVGRMLAGSGVHLLTGGGSGQMRAVAEAFVAAPERRGRSIGVIPCHPQDPTRAKNEGYPNDFVEIPIRTHLSGSGMDDRSRNHINVLSSDALIFLYGESGTLSEARLAMAYGRPRRLFLSMYTRRRFDCSELQAEFGAEEILDDLSELRNWVGSLSPSP
jgi:uncharacterized protein (TIGR00725 family)